MVTRQPVTFFKKLQQISYELFISPFDQNGSRMFSVYQKVIPASILSMHCQFIIIRSLEVENTAYRQEFVQMWTYEWGVFAACKVIPMAPIRHPAATCKCWSPDTRALNEDSWRFHNHREAPTRTFSWLKVPTTAFTFKNLLRHYPNLKLGCWCKGHKKGWQFD